MGEVMGSRRRGLGHGVPSTAVLAQPVIAQAAQQDVVRWLVFGVELEAGALEPLREIGLAGIAVDLVGGGSDGVAEDGEAAMLLPVLAEAPGDAAGDTGY